MSQSDQDAVTATVLATMTESAQENNVENVKSEILGLQSVCERRLSESFELSHHRELPSGAAAVEFSMLITGEYKPLVIPGENPAPIPKSLDLGVIAEDSINRDPDGFVRDLKTRAAENPLSPLNDVQTLSVEAVEAPPEGEKAVFTKKPTPQPTNPPFQSSILVDETDNSTIKTVLVAFIVATAGLIVMLGAFLLFRMAGRRAVKRHEEEMKRRERKRSLARKQKRKEYDYDEAHVEWVEDMDVMHDSGLDSSQARRVARTSISMGGVPT